MNIIIIIIIITSRGSGTVDRGDPPTPTTPTVPRHGPGIPPINI